MYTITDDGTDELTARVTPVAPFTVDGQDYVVGGFLDADWVRNAQAAGWAVVAKGRGRRRVTMVGLPESERGAILREFPVKVPHGVQFFVRTGVVESGTPEEFEADLGPRDRLPARSGVIPIRLSGRRARTGRAS